MALAPPGRNGSRPGGRSGSGSRADTPARVAAYRRGHRAERWAALLLLAKGYRIIGRRVKTPAIEIDLIARRGATVAFVEVKARLSDREALESVTASVQRRIVRGAHQWLARNPHYSAATLRFDIVTVVPGRWPHHIANAFDASPPGRASASAPAG